MVCVSGLMQDCSISSGRYRSLKLSHRLGLFYVLHGVCAIKVSIRHFVNAYYPQVLNFFFLVSVENSPAPHVGNNMYVINYTLNQVNVPCWDTPDSNHLWQFQLI